MKLITQLFLMLISSAVLAQTSSSNYFNYFAKVDFKNIKSQYSYSNIDNSGNFYFQKSNNSYCIKVNSSTFDSKWLFDDILLTRFFDTYSLSFKARSSSTINPALLHIVLDKSDTTVQLNGDTSIWHNISLACITGFQHSVLFQLMSVNTLALGNDFELKDFVFESIIPKQIITTPPQYFNKKKIINYGIFNLENDTFSIRIFEIFKDDRERVDIYYNGIRVYKNYKIIDNALPLQFIAKDDVNQIVVTARRMGYPPPCTGNFGIIDYSKKSRIFPFACDKKKCVSLYIVRKGFE